MTMQLWSPLHFLFIASPFIFAGMLYYFLKGKGRTDLRLAGITVSGISFLLLIYRNLHIYSNSQVISGDIIPLQICFFANLVLLFAFLFDLELLYGIAFCFSLPQIFFGILFINGLADYGSILSLQGAAYIFGYMLIAGITLWAFSVDLIKISLKTLVGIIGVVAGFFIVSVPMNNLFMKFTPGFLTGNHFGTYTSGNGNDLQTFLNIGHNTTFAGVTVNFAYVGFLIAAGTAVILVSYCIYLGLSLLRLRGKST